MNHVMVDIETLDTRPTASILSIGAVRFGNDGVKDEFYRVVCSESCRKVGLTTNKSTLEWWERQSKEARSVFNNPDSVKLPEALVDFSIFMDIYDVKLWGNGAAFDNAILSNAYAACGLIQPWAFWNDRCYRTVSAKTGTKRDQLGTYHNALDDARSQALHLIRFYTV